MNALKRLYNYINPKQVNFIEVELCGMPLLVLRGTIGVKADQDDAWWFYLTKHHEILIDVGFNKGCTILWVKELCNSKFERFLKFYFGDLITNSKFTRR